MKRLRKFGRWLARRRKAVMAFATQLVGFVVIFVPDWSRPATAGLGLLSAAIGLLVVHRVPNAPGD